MPPATWATAGFALLCLGVAVAFFAIPTYPGYDTMYTMVWGRELAHLVLPSYDAYRAPTPHPLAVGVAALLTPFGEHADRVMIALSLASFVALIAAMYRLARVLFTPLVGWICALLVLTRLDFGYLAARGYVDAPYLALVIWAAALEAERPRRGGPVWVLLALGGLLRPEGWVFAGLYAIWLSWSAPWARRLRYAAYAAVAPVLWVLTDLLITGDPIWSFTYTVRSDELLERQLGLTEVPEAVVRYLAQLTKAPILLAGVIGLAIALRIAPRKVALPAVLLVVPVGIFCFIAGSGLPDVNRYLATSALALILFAGLALGGFQMLERGTSARRNWALGALVLALAGGALTLARLNLGHVRADLQTRTRVRRNLTRLLDQSAVVAGRRCGPTSLPNHKLIPDVRWILDADQDAVIARSDHSQAARARRGVTIIVTGRPLIESESYGPYDQQQDDPRIQVPGPGFVPVATVPQFAGYVRC